MALTDKLKAIGNAIRSKTGKTGKLTLDEMVTEIEGISGGGESKPNPGELYQRVTSITNDSDSYFITDVIADDKTGAEIIASYSAAQDRVAMGSSTSTSNTRFFLPYQLSTSSVYLGFNTGTSLSIRTSVNTIYKSSLNFRNSRTSVFYKNSGEALVGTTLTQVLVQQTAPISICRYNNGNSFGAVRIMTIYGVRISQGEEIIRDYVPCYRKSDGVIGLYDKCNNTFLENAGEGTFTVGNEIEWES